MVTNNATQYTGVYDYRTDDQGQELANLKDYGGFSQNAQIQFDPIPYTAFCKIMRMDSQQLSLIIKESYAKIFHDLRGVFLNYVPGSRHPGIVMDMYFSKNAAPKPDDKIANLQDLTDVNRRKATTFEKQQFLNNLSGGKKYVLTDQTKILLADIMYGGKQAKENRPDNNRWATISQQIWQPTQDQLYRPNSGELMIKLSGVFDIYSVLKKIFGKRMITRTEACVDQSTGKAAMKNTQAECKYEIRFIKYSINKPYTFIVDIEQFDNQAVEEIVVRENPAQRFIQTGGNMMW